MRVTIHQPNYWPWLGLLDKIAKSDTLVILDDVVINKRSNQRRNVFFCNGRAKYLTLSAKYSDKSLIKNIKLANSNQLKLDFNKLRKWYSSSKHFNETIDEIMNYNILKGEYMNLSDLTIDTMKVSFLFLNINVNIVLASNLNYLGSKSDLNLSICNELGATTYLSGQGAKNYMTKEQIKDFEKNNIILEWHTFEHPIYPQQKKFDFVSGLACLDLFFWNGKDKSREIFWENVNR